MKKSLLVIAALLAMTGAHAQSDTLKKIKDSGSATMGVRESSGALVFTLGDGKYTGFHYDVCQHILAAAISLQKLAAAAPAEFPAGLFHD